MTVSTAAQFDPAGKPYDDVYASRKLFVDKVMPEIKGW